MLVLLPTQHRRGRPGRGCGKHVQDADGGVSPATTAIKQRYRQRIVKKADRLEEHVARLRQEIQKLEQKQCDIAKGVVQKTTPWKVVADYFRVFRHGYIAPTTQRHEVSCDSPRLHPGDKADVHRRFLQDVMALNVVFNGGTGCGGVAGILGIRVASPRRAEHPACAHGGGARRLDHRPCARAHNHNRKYVRNRASRGCSRLRKRDPRLQTHRPAPCRAYRAYGRLVRLGFDPGPCRQHAV
ncbi:hypothetical protein ON010_g16575 [Phytophthora cinnamomi]|nr:hypothetical protein ON010_g16575 [Phytophthora cinnamomi]